MCWPIRWLDSDSAALDSADRRGWGDCTGLDGIAQDGGLLVFRVWWDVFHVQTARL